MMALVSLVLGLAALVPLNPGDYRPMIDRNRGVVLLVAFWATWCEPCRDELPQLRKIERQSRGRIRLITISADEPEQDRAAEAFLRRAKMGAVGYRLSGTEVIAQVDPLWSGVLPAVFVYDATGTPRGKLVGEFDWAQLMKKLEQLTLPVHVDRPGSQRR